MQLINVHFHNAHLLVIDHNGQPYTAMKPIVEAMGLDWKSQFVKLKQKFASTVVEITIVAVDGKERLMTCMPVRKLAAWLYSISPNKVKPELRETVLKYQAECDDVLWDYWTKGQAINHRKSITPEQQAALHEIVDRRSNGERKVYAEMWARHNRHFKIAKYNQLLQIHFDEAVRYLEAMELKAKPQALPDPYREHNSKALASHMIYCNAWWQQFGGAIRQLNPNIAGAIHGHFQDGHCFAIGFLNQEERQQLQKRLEYYPWHLPALERHSFFKQN